MIRKKGAASRGRPEGCSDYARCYGVELSSPLRPPGGQIQILPDFSFVAKQVYSPAALCYSCPVPSASGADWTRIRRTVAR